MCYIFLLPPWFSRAAQVCFYRLQVVGACLVVGVIVTGPAVGKTAVRKVLASIASSGAMPRGEDSNGPVEKAGLMDKIRIGQLVIRSRGVHRQ